ncbi:acylphosphatase [Rhizobium sp. ICMP 5592]|uniref:acylphosphatase n=1 Tax=Rhizobium sp. ICMP 5592 TaxID=2292445 RepID=UPI001294ACD9|nr:acylphosphatase [Rhizobium sp. ICMP 5592]MQB41029.1 hypothetical protein [Rhizobium sp. ICMP 5592]
MRIAGKVQDVSYRAWTRNQALQLGLTGWVRDEPDGSVTALIVGSSVSGVEPQRTILNELPADFIIAH